MTGDELNTSFARLQQIDVDDMDDIIGSKECWVNKVKQKLNVEEEGDLTPGVFNSSSITKTTLAGWTGEAREIMTRQAELISNLQEMIELLKTEALADKACVIRLQPELLKSKDAELQSVKTTVQETVQNSAQEGIQSYSSALTRNIISTAPVFSPDTLKKAVRTAMVEEDRSKNLLVFGLAEKDGENVEQVVSDLFLELGDKPRVQAVNRLGGTGAEKARTDCRPVKVTLASATSVSQILTRTGRLKQTQQYRSVYVCPDRSPKERVARKQLYIVVDLKKAIVEKPSMHHYSKAAT